MDFLFILVPVIVSVGLGFLLNRLVQNFRELEAEMRHLKAEYGPVEQAKLKLGLLEREMRDTARRAELALSDTEMERVAKRAEIAESNRELGRLSKELAPLLAEENLVVSGFYRIAYSYPDSEKYRAAVEAVRDKQKEMVKAEKAVVISAATGEFGLSAKARLKLNKDVTGMLLRAFNGECDATIGKVSYKNFGPSSTRVKRAFEQLNKLGLSLNCSIDIAYLALKEMELKLVFEYLEMKHEEAEEQRAIKERMREEEKAERELRKATEEAEDDERRWQRALQTAKDKLAASTGQAHAELARQVAELQAQLVVASAAKERAMSMAQKTRSGYVYVISNIGSFGDDVYKVGMTRRLDPLDRVRELGDASVPFTFDVHALIYSEDAPTLETTLHRELRPYQLNKVNDRKEFFRVGLSTIEHAVNKHHGRFSLTRLAEAREFRETLALGGSGTGRPQLPEVESVTVFEQTSFGRTEPAPAKPARTSKATKATSAVTA